MKTVPWIGLGTWNLCGAEAESVVYEAIRCGYRLIDTARLYGNERDVGSGISRAIAEGIVSREDLFVTTKIHPSSRQAVADIRDSLTNLQLEYVDCVMLHWHGNHDGDIYTDIVRAAERGLCLFPGISGFYTVETIRPFIENFGLAPKIVQNENHLFCQNRQIRDYLSDRRVVLQSFYPLGGEGRIREVLFHPIVSHLAEKYGKSEAQIVLRWHVQGGCSAIPKTANFKHLKENLEALNFEFSRQDMLLLETMDCGRHYADW